MNKSVFNYFTTPVYVLNNTSNPYLNAARNENTFTTLINGTSTNVAIQLSNPNNSNKNIYINALFIRNTGSGNIGQLRLLSGATLVGTPQSPAKYNYSLGSANTGVAIIQSQTGTTVIASDGTVLEVASSVATPDAGIYRMPILIAPNTSLSVEVRQTTSPQIQIDYWEESI